MIVVVDSGVANVGSIANMLQKLGIRARISADAAEVRAADRLILPGVGAFDPGMRRLIETGLVDALNEAVLVNKRPVLGICLGMQLMSRGSEEGQLRGLGWIDADVVRFSFPSTNGASGGPRVPHMGWNVVAASAQSPLLNDLGDDPRFYFVHSYHLTTMRAGLAIASTRHGYEFISAIAKDNIFGVQFHPEKSHKYGLRLLRNFVQRV